MSRARVPDFGLMSHGIYLVGGGSALQEAAVWEAMLDGVSQLLYWPVALSGELLLNASTWLPNSLGDRPGLEVTTWLDLSDHHRESLDAFDLIFVGGGNTFDLLQRIRAAGITSGLRAFLLSGGTYYGGSAGAVVAGLDVGVASGLDPDRHHDPDHTGLGLVPADVLPHYAEPRIELAKDWSRQHPDRPLVCIPEASGVWYDSDEAIVCGPEPVDMYIDGENVARCGPGQKLAAR